MHEQTLSADAGKNDTVIFYAPEDDSFTDGAKEAGVSVDSFKQALTTVFAEAVAADVGGEIQDTELMRRLLDKLKVHAPLEKRTKEALKRALYAAAATTVLCFSNRNGMSEAQEGLEVHPCHDSDDEGDECERQDWSDWSLDVPENDDSEVVGVEQKASDVEARGEEAPVEEARGEEAPVEEVRGEEVRGEEARVPVEAGAGDAGVEQCTNEACEYTLLHDISVTSDAMNALYNAERWNCKCLDDKEFSEVLSKMNADPCTVKSDVNQLRELEKQEQDLRREVAAKHITLRPVIMELLNGYKKRPEQIHQKREMEKEMARIEKHQSESKESAEKLAKEMESFRNGKKRAMEALDYTQKWFKIQKCIEDCSKRFPDQKEETLEALMQETGSKMEEMEVELEKTRSAYNAIKEEWNRLDDKNREYKKDAEKFKTLVDKWRAKWYEWNEFKTSMVTPAF